MKTPIIFSQNKTTRVLSHVRFDVYNLLQNNNGNCKFFQIFFCLFFFERFVYLSLANSDINTNACRNVDNPGYPCEMWKKHPTTMVWRFNIKHQTNLGDNLSSLCGWKFASIYSFRAYSFIGLKRTFRRNLRRFRYLMCLRRENWPNFFRCFATPHLSEIFL